MHLYFKKKIRNLKGKSFDYRVFKEHNFNFILVNKEKIPCFDLLTKRQKEILIYKMAGYKNSEIGSKLNVATKTIKFHFTSICSVLNKHYFKNKILNLQSEKFIFMHIFYRSLLEKFIPFKGLKIVESKEENIKEYNKNNFLPTGKGNT